MRWYNKAVRIKLNFAKVFNNLNYNLKNFNNNKLSSNIHIKKRAYSCQIYTQVTINSILNLKHNPGYISSFTEAEDCFNVYV